MDMALKQSQINHPHLPLSIDVTKYVDIIYMSVLAHAPQRSVSRFTVQHRGGSIDYDYALLKESERGLYRAAQLCSITDYPDIQTSACVSKHRKEKT